MNFPKTEYCIFAHWCKRFEEFVLSGITVPEYIKEALIDSSYSCNKELIFNLFNAKIEPIINKDKTISSYWKNYGKFPRPFKKRFFENWNDESKSFDTWIFEDLLCPKS